MSWWKRLITYKFLNKQGDSGFPSEYEALVERAMQELALKTEAAIGLFQIDEAAWEVDQGSGTIMFTRPDGIGARASVQIIGTYNPPDSTWLWGWDHPSVAIPLRDHAEVVRRYGRDHDITELTESKLICDEQDCWRFTAMACLLNKAQGAYRGPTGGPLIFMTYGTATLFATLPGNTGSER